MLLDQGNCCTERNIWIVSTIFVVFVSTIVCSILFWLIRKLPREDTWMERIKQTYTSIGPSWRSDCEYDITYRGTNTNSMLVTNDDKLVKALHKGNTEKRVLFVGEPGIGKSHLFRSIARNWANGKILKDVILIYLQLGSVPKQACIVNEIMKLMKRENSEKEMHSLTSELQRVKSIVLLDGISNWSRYCNTNSNNANRNKNVLTVEELLEPNKKSFKNMKVWVTSRNIETDMKVMKGTYTTVNLNGLALGQTEKFFQKFLEMEVKGKQIWSVFLRIWQRQSKINELVNYITNTCCHKDVPIRSPAIARYLAKMYDIDQKTYFKDFPNMVKTTKDLIKSENIDLNLLVCLLEVGTTDDNVYRTCAILLHLKKLVFNHIKDEYFQEAMLRLLKTLKETDKVITSLTIYGACPTKLFSCLPKIEERLIICNVNFTEIDFLTVIRTPSQQKLTLEFHNSEVPETFPVIKLLDNYSTTNLSVFRYKKGENPAELSWEEGVWKIEENIHHSVEDNRPKEQDIDQMDLSHH